MKLEDWLKAHKNRSVEEIARIEAELKKKFPNRKDKPDPFWSDGDGSVWKRIIKRWNGESE